MRTIVSVPPRHYFHGNDRENTMGLVNNLHDSLGDVFLFDCDIYLSGTDTEFAEHMAAARRFKPDVGLALPNAGHGYLLSSRNRGNGKVRKFRGLVRRLFERPVENEKTNLFADELRIPLVLLWDHIITQAPGYIFKNLPSDRSLSEAGALADFSAGLSNPRFHHHIPDSGHIQVLKDLGVLPVSRVQRYVVAAHDLFVGAPSAKTDNQDAHLIKDAVLFAGNLYSDRHILESFPDRDLVEEIGQSIITQKTKDWTRPAWDLYAAVAAAKYEDGYAELHPDQTYYWRLGRDLLSTWVAGAYRLNVLKEAGLPIDFYGGFADPEFAREIDGIGGIHHKGSVSLERLAQIYRQYAVCVDITHVPFINGSNAKVLSCFAAGGFMLVDWKKDLRLELGDIADEFMYRNREELQSKIRFFQTDLSRRREIISRMQEIIVERLTFSKLLPQALNEALDNS